jgi:hypothetical protein
LFRGNQAKELAQAQVLVRAPALALVLASSW